MFTDKEELRRKYEHGLERQVALKEKLFLGNNDRIYQRKQIQPKQQLEKRRSFGSEVEDF